ncbi:hypothetical protein Taro_042124 [Colocasia esculenta]|uniref:Uncharacterized protein n=1 Tax=Colocasia esculenta TaxID=4460 RepID=A0A843WRW7_COLES|nr:hypothetical protein [Colocasia esculenta]
MKNESLEVWFGKLVLEVHSLDYLRAGNSGRKIYQIISALKEVEQLHQVEENPQMGRSLAEVQRYLQDMFKALSVDNDTMSTFITSHEVTEATKIALPSNT